MSEAKRQRVIEELRRGVPVDTVATEVDLSRSEVYKIRGQVRVAQPEEQAPGKPKVGPAQFIMGFDPSLPEYLGHKTLDGKRWQVACLSVKLASAVITRGWRAVLFLETGATSTEDRGPFELNPVDEEYTLQRTVASPVDIPGGERRRFWDILIAPQSASGPRHSITSGPIYAMMVPADARGMIPAEMDWCQGGACIATPITMTRRGVPQTHLLPGDYVARIEVKDEAGDSVGGRFRIIAPRPGEPLTITHIPD